MPDPTARSHTDDFAIANRQHVQVACDASERLVDDVAVVDIRNIDDDGGHELEPRLQLLFERVHARVRAGAALSYFDESVAKRSVKPARYDDPVASELFCQLADAQDPTTGITLH